MKLENICQKSLTIGMIAMLLSIIFPSCKRSLELDPPLGRVVSGVVFTSEMTATAAVIGMYSKLMQGTSIANFNNTIFGGMLSDEFEFSNQYPEFFSNSLTTSNTEISNQWNSGFNLIYHANVIIEGLKQSENISEPVQQQLLGEAFFMRALCYFYLTNYWGAVPLLTTTDYNVNRIAERKSPNLVYDQIVNDLHEAQILLGEDYVHPDRIRPNKLSATALLARVYLYMKEWALAEQQASSVIDQASFYQLTPNLADVFLKNSKETIWQLSPVSPTINTFEGAFFIPPDNSIPNPGRITSSLISAFTANDGRFASWIGSVTVNGDVYYFPYKYKTRNSSSVTEFNIVFRLAEQYLIRAEARAQQNNLLGAKEDIDAVRSRAGLANAVAGDLQEVLIAIESERRLEFFAEWGHRWFDLKRMTGFTDPNISRADEVLGAIKANWAATDMLLPIPQTEIDKAPQLVQNPGY